MVQYRRLNESVMSGLVRSTKTQKFQKTNYDTEATVNLCKELTNLLVKYMRAHARDYEKNYAWKSPHDVHAFSEIEFEIFLSAEQPKNIARTLFNTLKRLLPNLQVTQNALNLSGQGGMTWMADNSEKNIPDILVEIEFTEDMGYIHVSLLT